MKRRNVLAALGSLSAGGAFTVGSGAFTSVSAERSVTVDVVGDANAFLRLAPCDGSPNGDYVANASEGAMAIDLADGDSNVAGSGVNPEAHSVFHNVFEICNQGTQPVCVDFAVDVPSIPGPVPDRYGFEEGDPAVVFYRADNPDDTVNVDDLDTDRSGAFPLDVGDCQCVGFEVRAFGFESGADLFGDTDLEIRAQAGANCESEDAPPEPINPETLRLDTGGELNWQETYWQVVSGPGTDGPGTEDTPYRAKVVDDPPNDWDTSSPEASWVDPFGTGGLDSDPADAEDPYVYELTFSVPATFDLVMEEYGSDNPVTFLLDGTEIGSSPDGEDAYNPLKDNISSQQIEAGNHTLRAEVINEPQSGTSVTGNPTGLLVAARLEPPQEPN
ncbi:DUF1102 family [Halapricum desulfuricans]|uniref:DUF1102 family n=1 Tax=Halapricum desulfuricans TaxID=2841257 RepID=A0A897NKE4_9EURY|nr:hypothetical protein [Halapricum desulfuricans]QSG10746.1 DUF1102 family [Halapricum desulfuricans]